MTASYILRKEGDFTRASVLANVHAQLDKLPGNYEWEIEIKRHVRKRTDDQNKALWGLAYKILEKETGQEAADWHEFMCGEYFGWTETVMLGKRKLKPKRSTSRLSTIEFADFFDFIQRKAAENGIFIPDPDPLWKENRGKAA